MERLLQWVGGVVWSWRSEVTVCAQCPPAYPADQALTLLQAQLQVLHAIGPDMCPQKLAVLRLRDWPMTRAIMQALQGLPQWPCAVHISTSQWPLEPNEYRSLAQYIPTRCVCVRVCVCARTHVCASCVCMYENTHACLFDACTYILAYISS